MTDLYQVTGNPVGHSLSPRIHTAFAKQCQQDLTYRAFKLESEAFMSTMRELLTTGQIKGSNVTVPHKELAWQLAQRRSAAAELAGAVNTLSINDAGEICGDNTDGSGLVADLQNNLGFDLSGARILLLGAGGAVRGVILPLLNAGIRELVLANRTLAKAEALKELFADERIIVSRFEEIPAPAFDLIINGTAASLAGDLPPVPSGSVSGQTLAYDMMYSPKQTPFCAWAAGLGARSVDGLGMLVEQAADAFQIWRGVRPETTELLAQLRAEISGN
ncbi:MAG TPA: shikimate dehydrogenase [Marinobacterium sp.]|nr:shikimate dehydrogenase [Marinobacterium sp.]